MKHHTIYIILNFMLFFIGLNTKAQNFEQHKDSIYYKSKLLHYQYFVNGHKVSSEKVLELMPDSTIIYDNYSSANNACVFGYILGVSGISFIIAPAIMSLFGNNKAWSMAYAGAGMTLVSIPLFIKHRIQIPKVIGAYNQNLDRKTAQSKKQLNFSINSSGIGFCFKF